MAYIKLFKTSQNFKVNLHRDVSVVFHFINVTS